MCELQKSIKQTPRFCVLIPKELNEYSYARFNQIENTNKYLVSKFANRLASTLSNRDKNRLKYKYMQTDKGNQSMIESIKKTKKVKTYQNLVTNLNLTDITATQHLCIQSCNKKILCVYNFNIFEVMAKYIVITLVLYLETGNIPLQNVFILICKFILLCLHLLCIMYLLYLY